MESLEVAVLVVENAYGIIGNVSLMCVHRGNLRFDDLLFTIYLQFYNLAIYRAAGNFDFSLFTFHFSLFTSPKATFLTFHFAEGDRRAYFLFFSANLRNYIQSFILNRELFYTFVEQMVKNERTKSEE